MYETMQEICNFFPAHPPVLTYHCDVFLAPSTIPGSAWWKHKQNKTPKFCVLVWIGCYSSNFVILNHLNFGDIACRCRYYIWTMRLGSCACSLRIVLHQICGLIPNRRYRSFCRARFPKGRDIAAELDDTVFAHKLSPGPDYPVLCLWPQQDTPDLGSRLRLGYKPPRECQCESYRD